MKKVSFMLFCGFLCVLLLVGCAAQTQAEAPSQTEESLTTSAPEESKPAPTEESTAEDYSEPVAVDAFYGTWTNSYGIVAEHAVPRIEGLQGEEIEALNAEIYRQFCTDKFMEDKGIPGGDYTKYDWYISNGVFTLVVETAAANDIAYGIYSVDIETAHVLTGDEVLARAGISDFSEQATVAAGYYFAKFFEDGILQDNPEVEPFVFQDGFDATVSEENVAAMLPYFGADGEILICGTLYTYVGAGSQQVLFPLTGYEAYGVDALYEEFKAL